MTALWPIASDERMTARGNVFLFVDVWDQVLVRHGKGREMIFMNMHILTSSVEKRL